MLLRAHPVHMSSSPPPRRTRKPPFCLRVRVNIVGSEDYLEGLGDGPSVIERVELACRHKLRHGSVEACLPAKVTVVTNTDAEESVHGVFYVHHDTRIEM
jgi:hypothetical protein